MIPKVERVQFVIIEVEIVALISLEGDGGVLYVFQNNFVEIAGFSEVLVFIGPKILAAFEHDGFVEFGVGFVVSVRAAAEKGLVEIFVEILSLHDVLGQNVDTANALQIAIVLVLHFDLESVFVEGLDVLPLADKTAGALTESATFFIPDQFEGENDVVGGDRFSIRPGGVGI